MDDFNQTVQDDIVVEKVNLTRATMNEAILFRSILQKDIEKKFKKVVIDISQCEFVDSTFLGAMIFARRGMDEIGGQLRVVQPTEPFKAFLERTMVFEIFNPHNSLGEAINSFN